MLKQLKELYSLLTRDQRNKLIRLQLLVIIMAVAELARVLSIGPFMALVADTSKLEGTGVFATIYRTSGIVDHNSFFMWFGVGVLVVLSVKYCG